MLCDFMTFPTTPETITQTDQEISGFLSQINWAQPSWDLLIIFLFIVSAFFYGFSLGRSRIIVILISIYMALAVTNVFPYLGKTILAVHLERFFAFPILVFLLVFVILLFLFSRTGFPQGIRGKSRWWEIILFSILHVGLLISVILSFLPAEFLQEALPVSQIIFASALARFLWVTLPIVSMVLVKGEEG